MNAAMMLTLNILFFCYAESQTPARFDVVIDEIFADPLPQVSLPKSEFIELRNVSGRVFNLRNWKISDGVKEAKINADFYLKPDSFVVLCRSSSVNLFSNFGACIGMSSFPTLNNDGDLVQLLSPGSVTIHAIFYKKSWFNNAVKSEGGWSLEMIDTKNPCGCEDNWRASIDPKGGSPGKINSVDDNNPDHQPPALIRSYTQDDQTIVAVFDESLDSLSASAQEKFSINNNPATIVEAKPISPLFKEVKLKLADKLSGATVYELSVKDVADCSGNLVGQFNHTRAGLPGDADSLNIVINEILFHPKPGANDYIECYNRTGKVLDASALYIAGRNSSREIISVKKISETPFLIFPGDYVTLTKDSMIIQEQYVCKNPRFLITVPLQSLPNDKGDVIILNKSGNIIDELKYNEGWHFPLISNNEGVALERIDPEKPTQSQDNWTSASSTVGYGTPTYMNSQLKSLSAIKGEINVSPKIFSPDNYGIDDICYINYAMDEPNYVANISIFDVNANLVCRPYQNATLSQAGFLRWNGLNEKNQKLPAGMYIIFTEVFNLKGKSKKFKTVVVLAKKF